MTRSNLQRDGVSGQRETRGNALEVRLIKDGADGVSFTASDQETSRISPE